MPNFHLLPRVDDSSEEMNRDAYHGSSKLLYFRTFSFSNSSQPGLGESLRKVTELSRQLLLHYLFEDQIVL